MYDGVNIDKIACRLYHVTHTTTVTVRMMGGVKSNCLQWARKDENQPIFMQVLVSFRNIDRHI